MKQAILLLNVAESAARLSRAPASEKHTVILGSVSAVVSHAGLRRGGCKSPPAKVLNDSAVEAVHLSRSDCGWDSTLPVRMLPLGSGVHRLQVGRWRWAPPTSHQGPPVCVKLAALWRCRVQTDTDSFDVRRPPRPTSRLRARLLFSAFIYVTFLFLLFQLFSVIV